MERGRQIRMILGMATLLALAGCQTPETLVSDYVKSSLASEKHSKICEKSLVSLDDYTRYLKTQEKAGNFLLSADIIKIKTEESLPGEKVVSADIYSRRNRRKYNFIFSVHTQKSGHCIQFVNGARLTDAVGPDFTNNKGLSSNAYLPLKLDTYYNYNVSELADQFYSTRITHPGDTGLDLFRYVYIKKSDDIDGRIYEALRSRGAYIAGDLSNYTSLTGISFQPLDEYEKERISKDIYAVDGEQVLFGGDSQIMFLANPRLIEPSFNIPEE